VQVDILSWRNKTQRVHVQVKDICAILSGLVVAQDYKRGQALVVNRNFADNAEFFQVLPLPCSVPYYSNDRFFDTIDGLGLSLLSWHRHGKPATCLAVMDTNAALSRTHEDCTGGTQKKG